MNKFLCISIFVAALSLVNMSCNRAHKYDVDYSNNETNTPDSIGFNGLIIGRAYSECKNQIVDSLMHFRRHEDSLLECVSFKDDMDCVRFSEITEEVYETMLLGTWCDVTVRCYNDTIGAIIIRSAYECTVDYSYMDEIYNIYKKKYGEENSHGPLVEWNFNNGLSINIDCYETKNRSDENKPLCLIINYSNATYRNLHERLINNVKQKMIDQREKEKGDMMENI